MSAAANVYEKLTRLEAVQKRGNISQTEYKRKKWLLLRELQKRQLTVQPSFKKQNFNAIKDSLKKEYNYILPGLLLVGKHNECAELQAGFYIGKYPVTVREFRIFLEQTGWDYPQEDIEKLESVSPQTNCPASHVSWNDAKAYCRWLRRETDEYYSLPSDLQWELAARGIDGRLYPWGYDQIEEDSACFEGEKHYSSTIPVDTFPKNRSPFNCMDMVGNVWEWCLDTIDDPREPHILRGGSWKNSSEYSNCIAKTFSYPPDKRPEYAGFRVLYVPKDSFNTYCDKMGYKKKSIQDQSGSHPSQPDNKEESCSAKNSIDATEVIDARKKFGRSASENQQKQREDILARSGLRRIASVPSSPREKLKRNQIERDTYFPDTSQNKTSSFRTTEPTQVKQKETFQQQKRKIVSQVNKKHPELEILSKKNLKNSRRELNTLTSIKNEKSIANNKNSSTGTIEDVLSNLDDIQEKNNELPVFIPGNKTKPIAYTVWAIFFVIVIILNFYRIFFL